MGRLISENLTLKKEIYSLRKIHNRDLYYKRYKDNSNNENRQLYNIIKINSQKDIESLKSINYHLMSLDEIGDYFLDMTAKKIIESGVDYELHNNVSVIIDNNHYRNDNNTEWLYAYFIEISIKHFNEITYKQEDLNIKHYIPEFFVDKMRNTNWSANDFNQGLDIRDRITLIKEKELFEKEIAYEEVQSKLNKGKFKI